MRTDTSTSSCCGPNTGTPARSASATSAAGACVTSRDAHDHDHDRSHGHHQGPHAGHDHGNLPGWPRLIAALAMAAAAELWHALAPDGLAWRAAGMGLAVLAIALAGLGVYRDGLRSLGRARLDINALMTVAVTGAFLIGQWPEAAMVMALYALAERIEEGAADRARGAIAGLMALTPDTAEVLDANGRWRTVPARDVEPGEVIRVAPGARIALDGQVIDGRSAVNQAAVTGESIPVDKAAGDAVFAGTVNDSGELRVRVTAAASRSTLARIIEAVEQAQASRAPTQRFVQRFAAIYTPVVFAIALGVAVLAPLLFGWAWLDAVYKALVLLVIACPCALVISTPVTVVSGLAAAARRGILIKGGRFLEEARRLRVVALDKTGTLTQGRPTLVHRQAWGDGDAERARQAWHAALALAQHSDHPVSRALAAGLVAQPRTDDLGAAGKATPSRDDVTTGAADATSAPDASSEVSAFQALAGRGSEGVIDGTRWLLGNHRVIEERGLCSPTLEAAVRQQESQGRTVTLLADDDGVRALFAVADTPRPQAAQAMADLRSLGLRPVMLSGDNARTAEAIGRQVGIDDARGDLLPADKLAALDALRQRHGAIAMVGDGINDAPALARADIGFAIGGGEGGAGTDIAMESADVVLLNDDLGRIAETVRLSRRTHRVLWQNITLALGIKAVFLALAVAGDASMWMAVFADMGASLLVVGNGMRLLRGAPAGDAAR
jgi:Cd2+/Zn2+-exporting ATPase